MANIKLAKLHDISEKISEVVFKDKTIILFKYQDKISAFQGNCPHKNTPLSLGHVENGHIVCPAHKWKFSCITGKESTHKSCLKSYPITIEGEYILIDEALVKEETTSIKDNLRSMKDLPSPKGDFITGHLAKFRKPDIHMTIKEWASELGTMFTISLVGKKMLIVTDPKINKEILKQRPGKFRRFYKVDEIMREMGIIGVSNVEGETWKQHRKITTAALNAKNVNGFFPIMERVTEKFHRKLQKHSKDNSSVEIQEELMRYTVDIVTTISFGYEMNTLESGEDVIQKHLSYIFPMFAKRMTSPFPIWRYVKSKKSKEFDIALQEVKDKVDFLISEGKKRLLENPTIRENPSNYLEALLVEKEKEGDFSEEEIFGNVLTTLLAGEDTTSNSISWAMYYLAQHPEVVKKIKDELESICGDSPFPRSVNEIAKLKYTEAVVNEVLRMKSVTPFLIHDAIEDVVIEDVLVKKGTMIMNTLTLAHGDSDYFERPEEFIPERWIASGCPIHGNHSPKVAMTFGAGTRYCPGAYMATLMMMMGISAMCKNFQVSLDTSRGQVGEVLDFAIQPENLWLTFKEEALSTL